MMKYKAKSQIEKPQSPRKKNNQALAKCQDRLTKDIEKRADLARFIAQRKEKEEEAEIKAMQPRVNEKHKMKSRTFEKFYKSQVDYNKKKQEKIQ